MGYSFKDYNKENMAIGIGRSLPISTKQSIEICNAIRNRSVEYTKEFLNNVAEGKKAVLFRRFNKDMGHKKKTGPGRYPKKAALGILRLIESIETNAQFKGLNTSNLVIKSIIPNKAAGSWHYGRQRRRRMKRTNIEVVLKEKTAKDKRKND